MILGGYPFPWTPDKFSKPRAEKSCAWQVGYGVVGFLSWGPILAGVKILLEWNFMSAEQFDALNALYLLDEDMVWEVGAEAPTQNYNVQALTFDGKLFEVAGYEAPWRKDVKMEFLIRSLVA